MTHCPKCGLTEGIAGHCPHHGWHEVPPREPRMSDTEAIDGMRNEVQRLVRRLDLMETTMQDCVAVLKELQGKE